MRIFVNIMQIREWGEAPFIARSFARRSFDRSKNARKRKRLLAVYMTTFLTTRKAAESGRRPKSTRPTDFCRMCTSSFAIRGEYIPKVSHGVALVNYNEHMNSLFSKNVCSPVKIRFVIEHVDIIVMEAAVLKTNSPLPFAAHSHYN